MESLNLKIHSETPELRKIDKVIEELNNGSVILYPSDTGFTLGCQLSNKNAINKIRQIRHMTTDKRLTFLCYSLSDISEYAKVSNEVYRALKRLIPGPYTFILPASKNVPKFAQNPKRKTAGIRVPDSTLVQLLLKRSGNPILSISAKLVDDESDSFYYDPDDIIRYYSKLVDIVVTSNEYNFKGESTLIDMTSEPISIMRKGAGYESASEILGIA